MTNPTVFPRPGVFLRHRPTFLAAVTGPQPYAGVSVSRTIRDKACAICIIALVVTTTLLGGVLVAWEANHYGEGSAAPGISASLPPPEPSEAVLTPTRGNMADSRTRIDPAELTLWSVPVNLLIFVALGLYLRWDSQRKN